MAALFAFLSLSVEPPKGSSLLGRMGCLFGEGPQKRVVRLLTRYLTLYSLGAEPLTIPMVRGHSLFRW